VNAVYESGLEAYLSVESVVSREVNVLNAVAMRVDWRRTCRLSR